MKACAYCPKFAWEFGKLYATSKLLFGSPNPHHKEAVREYIIVAIDARKKKRTQKATGTVKSGWARCLKVTLHYAIWMCLIISSDYFYPHFPWISSHVKWEAPLNFYLYLWFEIKKIVTFSISIPCKIALWWPVKSRGIEYSDKVKGDWYHPSLLVLKYSSFGVGRNPSKIDRIKSQGSIDHITWYCLLLSKFLILFNQLNLKLENW